jgi:predicted ATPase
LDAQAVGYWRTAGEKAVRRASNREAIGHFHQALALNQRQAPGVDRSLTELSILSQLGPALMSVYGWSAPEVGSAFERAEHLARELERSADLAPPLVGLWLFHTSRGHFSRAEEITKELFNVAHALHDPNILLQAHHCTWPINWLRGALTDAKAHADAGLGLYDEARHAKHRFLYLGHDPAVCALSIRSVLQWALGYPTQGVQSERDAIDLARRLQHVPSLAHAFWFVCQAQAARSDAVAVAKTAKELLTLSEEHGLPLTHGAALGYLGWAIAQTDDVSGGIRRMEEGLAMYNRLGLRTNLCMMICLLAETYFLAGQYEKGMQQVSLAIDTSSEIGERWCLPRIHTIRARLLRTFGQVDAAEASLRMAVEIAATQSAKGAQLHAANSLARLWRDQGKPRQAHELIAPVYGWFTEGFDTRDLREAKTLLEQSAS